MGDGLLELRDWLLENEIPRVGMEVTASYWRPPRASSRGC